MIIVAHYCTILLHMHTASHSIPQPSTASYHPIPGKWMNMELCSGINHNPIQLVL